MTLCLIATLFAPVGARGYTGRPYNFHNTRMQTNKYKEASHIKVFYYNS